MPNLYVTLPDMKDFLGIPLADTTKDALVQSYIDAVVDAINRWTGTDFSGPQVVTGEPFDARRQDIILTENSPLISVQEIRLGVKTDGSSGTVLDPGCYFADKENVSLLLNLPQQRGYGRIDYTYGYATVPPTVQLATKLGVEGYYRMRTRQAVGVTSKSKEGESINFKAAWHSEAGLPVESVSLLSDFRSAMEWPTGSGTGMATRNK